MSVFLARYWPLVIVTVLFWIIMTLLVLLSMQQSDGKLIYPLDDTYIHMAIAKNAALHQVWGVTKYAFSSTTSSPLWTLLLTFMYMVFGVNDWAPLLLNVLFGTILIVAAGLFLDKAISSINTPETWRTGTSLRVIFSRIVTCRRFISVAVLIVALFVSPLPTLVMIGMEHVLHTLLTLLFLGFAISVLDAPFAGSRAIGRKKSPFQADIPIISPKAFLPLVFLAPALVMVRYEGLFLVFAVCVFMVMQKKWLGAILTGSAALLPVIGYGLWSVSRGWYFLPNPILLKGHMPDHNLPELVAILQRTLFEIQSNPHILLLIIASLALVLLHQNKPSENRLWYAHLIWSGTLLLHMVFASTGWLYRYEAYLVFVGILIVGASAAQLIPGLMSLFFENMSRKHSRNDTRNQNANVPEKFNADHPGNPSSDLPGNANVDTPANPNTGHPGNAKTVPTRGFFDRFLPVVVVLLLAGIIAFPFVHRAAYAFILTPMASGNIYEQHYQMGRFLSTFHQGDAVAANDIGAISWMADIRLFDLLGLGSLEPAVLRKNNRYSMDDIDRLAKQHDIAIAIVYDDWFDGEQMPTLPPEWERVGQWRIFGNVIAGSDVVSFYAVDPSKKSDLIRNLNRFSEEVPAGVEQTGLLPAQ